MEATARKVVPGEVTRAVRDSETPAGPVRSGDWLGLSRNGIEVVGETLADAACSLLELLVGGDHDLVTIIEGEGSGAADTRRITEWLKEARPVVETEVHHGGQPLYPYLFSIE
jgi:dihydroxyacetone kinase-like predicted kinase